MLGPRGNGGLSYTKISLFFYYQIHLLQKIEAIILYSGTASSKIFSAR